MPDMPQKKSAKMSQTEERDLDMEISFMAGLVRRDPSYVEALQILGDAYTKRGRLVEGLEVDEALAQLKPTDAIVHYNLACSYSLTNRLELSCWALGRAIDLGYRDFRWLARDPDLVRLRQNPLYRKIKAKIRSLKAQSSGETQAQG
jgi:hypothetical protein